MLRWSLIFYPDPVIPDIIIFNEMVKDLDNKTRILSRSNQNDRVTNIYKYINLPA